MSTPGVTLDPVHAVELSEMLGYMIDWLDSDRVRLGASLAAFTKPSTDGASPDGRDLLDELRHDLHRFAFLLGADDTDELLAETQP